MEPEMILLEAEEAMTKAVEYLIHEFASVRTGKASPSLVENLDVHVHSYGMNMKLKQLGTISTPEPRLIRVEPFDPSTIQDIDRAFRESRLGLNPAVEGKVIRIPIPELSHERRQQMVKLIKSLAEDAKVRVRACRRDALEALKKAEKDGLISEDDLRRDEKEVQVQTDKHVADIEKHVVSKEKEITTI
ncbi:MAG: ribosome recycling factor [Verrucomicrobiaceae bacterium]|nr:ribosome recycling factor [Verrucomicrobiaceae bacterium]